MAACFYSCYSRKRRPPSPSPPIPLTTKTTVWPAPESPSPLPLPSPERPRLKKLNSHPLPELAVAVGGSCVKSYDFDTIASLCNQFRSSQRGGKPSMFRCVLEDVCLPVDVILIEELKNKQVNPRITDEAWITSVNLMAQVEQHNLCRVVGFSIKGRRRLIIMEAPHLSCRVEQVIGQLDWESRLNIALSCASTLDELHNKSPLLQHGFGAWNVLLVENMNRKKKKTVWLQLLLVEENSNECKASNVRGFGILLLELVSGKRNMEELLTTESTHGYGDALFVKWATGMVNDRIKLSNIVDPKLLLHCPSLSAVKELAAFALTCLHSDPLHRPTMHKAITLLNSLLAQVSSSRKPGLKSHTLGRSATFCHHYATPPPPSRITTTSNCTFSDMRSSGTRSAGTSPARYMTSWTTTRITTTTTTTTTTNTCLL